MCLNFFAHDQLQAISKVTKLHVSILKNKKVIGIHFSQCKSMGKMSPNLDSNLQISLRIWIRTKSGEVQINLKQIRTDLEGLHWGLNRIKAQPQFPGKVYSKVLVITIKALHGLGPGYVRDRLLPCNPPHTLRSSGKNLLQSAKTRLAGITQRPSLLLLPDCGMTCWRRSTNSIAFLNIKKQ